MRTKRFFFALTLTAIAVLSPCIAGAQSPAPKGKLERNLECHVEFGGLSGEGALHLCGRPIG